MLIIYWGYHPDIPLAGFGIDAFEKTTTTGVLGGKLLIIINNK